MLFPGESFLPLPAFLSWLQSAVLCVELKFCDPSSTHLGMSVVQLMFRQPCWCDFMGVASDVTWRQSYSKPPDPSALNSLLPWPTVVHPSLPQFFWKPKCGELFYRCIHWEWALYLRIWISCFLLRSPSIVKRLFLDEGWRMHLFVTIRTNI